jgi:hypothetical protein
LIGRIKGKEKREDGKGEAHCEEGEAVTGHEVDRRLALHSTSLDFDLRERKIAPTEIFGTVKVINGFEYILVLFPEHLSYFEAGGHGLVVLKDGHEVATS